MRKKSKIKFWLVMVIAIVGVGAFVWFKKGGTGIISDIKSGLKENETSQNLVLLRTEESKTSLSDLQSGKKQTYTHKRLGFSFEFPEGFNVGEFSEVEGEEQILVQKDNVGFQMRISSFDENIVLTADRIKQDLPDVVIKEPIQIKVGEAVALAFLSEDESLGKTREVWWVYGGFLYQITTYAEFDETMVAILETWRFK